MKRYLLVLPLILVGCATSPKFNKEDKMLASYPVTISQEDFDFSELLLMVKIDHENKTVEKCHGLFPDNPERTFINNLYLAHKSQNRVNYEKKLIMSLKDKQTEYVIYHISGDETLVGSSIKGCERLQVLLQQDGYKLIEAN